MMSDITNHPFLAEEDVRAMVRLLGEVAVVDGGHARKKSFLMDGLAGLIGADFWSWALHRQEKPGEPMVYVAFMHGGFSDEQFTNYLKALEHPGMAHVGEVWTKELQDRNTHLTRLRSQVDPDDRFINSEAYQLWLKAGIGNLILSARPVEVHAYSAIAMLRKENSPPFTERESKMIHIVLTEVSWLHKMGWPEDRAVSVPRLYPRQRVVLNLLLEGKDRKTIASHLEISPNTVSSYVKEVYRHFEVNSQAGLLVRFFQGNGGDRE